ncbi:MAG: S8 family peptidase [Cyclobacteriaceae bacterium]|nr:S8 family peptidase [Cyclobacteriaceae bacterium]
MTKWIAVFLIILLDYSHAQVNRYVVFFQDKAGSPYSMSNPSAFLSARSLARRNKNQVPVTQEDLPVTPAYVDNLRNAGANVLYTSRWFNAAVIQCPVSLLSTLLGLPGISRIELVAPGARPSGRLEATSLTQEVTDAQLAFHRFDEMHEDDIQGEGVYVAIFDSGFRGADTLSGFRHAFDEGRVPAALRFNLVNGGNQVFTRDDHGTAVWSVIAGKKAGVFTGGAFKATFMLAITEDVSSEYRIEEYNWVVAAERADSAGVDVINTSLGYNTFDDPAMDYLRSNMNGQTAIISQAARKAAQRGIVVVVSAGNEGARAWQIITAPADAHDVLAVGNVNNSGLRNPTSSVGPSADGRIKPDVAALGTAVAVLRGNGVIGSLSGTSLAAPMVASLAAGLIQKFPDATMADIIRAIKMGASQAGAPDNQIGYGIVSYSGSRNYLQNLSAEPKLLFFPNPLTTEMLTIISTNPQAIPSANCRVINHTGQVVGASILTFPDTNPSVSISFSNLPSGMYFVQLSWASGSSVVKIIKP